MKRKQLEIIPSSSPLRYAPQTCRNATKHISKNNTSTHFHKTPTKMHTQKTEIQTPKIAAQSNYFGSTIKRLQGISCHSPTNKGSIGLSPSPSKLLRSITKQEAEKKVDELNQWWTRKKLCQQTMALKATQESLQKCKQKPKINQTSEAIYKELKYKKALSKDVLQRFQEYKIEKMEQTLQKFVQRHVEETNSLPSLQKMYQFNKQEVTELMKLLQKTGYRPPSAHFQTSDY